MIQIKCSQCNEIIGSIEKPELTQADIDLYRGMVTCSNGHQEVDLNVNGLEEEQEEVLE